MLKKHSILNLISKILIFIFTFSFINISKVKAASNGNFNLDTYVSSTGTPPFDSSSAPGKDRSESDNYVRTSDTVKYKVDFSFNSLNSNPIGSILTLEIQGQNVKWSSRYNPIEGITVSNNGKTLTIDLGQIESGHAYSRDFVADVLNNAENGSRFSVRATISSKDSSVSSSSDTSEETIVSAKPQYDLEKKMDSFINAEGPNGEAGKLILYSIKISKPKGKGNEAVEDPITFEDDLSEFGVPNAKLYTWGQDPGVGINGYGRVLNTAPYGRNFRPNNRNSSSKSVADSGQITATQSSPGSKISVTINNVDTINDHFPTKNVNGSSIPSDKHYVFSGYIGIWVKNSDIPREVTQIKNKFTSLNLTSLSNQANNINGSEPMENNVVTSLIRRAPIETTQTAPSANVPSRIKLSSEVKYTKALRRGQKLDTATGLRSGDGTLLEGQDFAARVNFENTGSLTLKQGSLLIKIDPNKVQLLPMEDSAYGRYPHVTDGALLFLARDFPLDSLTVEYGTTNYANFQEQHDDVGANTRWYSSLKEAIDSNTGDVSCIRVNYNLPDGNPFVFRGLMVELNLRAKRAGMAPITIATQANQVNSGRWNTFNYNPVDHSGRNGSGDRVAISKALARISKESSKRTYKVRETATFTLTPTLTADSNFVRPGVYHDIVIKDILPEGLTYVKDSSMQNNRPIIPTITPQKDGSTLLVWTIPHNEVNQAIPPLTYDAKVNLDLDTGDVLENTAIVESKADFSIERLRTSKVGINIVSVHEWGIEKNVLTPVIPLGGDIVYELVYYQNSQNEFRNIDLLDILPSNPDGRGNNFHGDYVVKDIRGSHGESIFVTTDSINNYNQDPTLNSFNWMPFVKGDSVNERVTAIKVHSDSLPIEREERKITVTLQSLNNRKNDIYKNDFSAKSETINQVVRSNKVSTRVVSSAIGRYVWMDINENGVKDPNERGIPNVRLTLRDKFNNIVKETTTDKDGLYRFDNLIGGTYRVEVDKSTLPGFVQNQYPNYVYQVYEKDSSLNGSTNVNLGDNEINDTINFGYNYNIPMFTLTHSSAIPQQPQTMVPKPQEKIEPPLALIVQPSMVSQLQDKVKTQSQEKVKPPLAPTLQPSMAPQPQEKVEPPLAPALKPSMVPQPQEKVEPPLAPALKPSMVPQPQEKVEPPLAPALKPSMVPQMQEKVEPPLSPALKPSMVPQVQYKIEPPLAPALKPSMVPQPQEKVEPPLAPALKPSMVPQMQEKVEPPLAPALKPSMAPQVQHKIEPPQAPILQPSMVPQPQEKVEPPLAPALKPSMVPQPQEKVEPPQAPTLQPSMVPKPQEKVEPPLAPALKPSMVPQVQHKIEPPLAPILQPSMVPQTQEKVEPPLAPTLKPSMVPQVQHKIEPPLALNLKPSVLPQAQQKIQPSPRPTVEPSKTSKNIQTSYLNHNKQISNKSLKNLSNKPIKKSDNLNVDKEKLPNTGTENFNLLLLGLFFLIISIILNKLSKKLS
ncbi:SdrD B-like domain-containing protein [Clostridium oceanicum]|uniref:SD-repeat containing protein B domain-containing protein n=1 Tax=Clostridium oceanicum TaxID=1543 RepID=A0ABP3UUT4_9CLOT